MSEELRDFDDLAPIDGETDAEIDEEEEPACPVSELSFENVDFELASMFLISFNVGWVFFCLLLYTVGKSSGVIPDNWSEIIFFPFILITGMMAVNFSYPIYRKYPKPALRLIFVWSRMLKGFSERRIGSSLPLEAPVYFPARSHEEVLELIARKRDRIPESGDEDKNRYRQDG